MRITLIIVIAVVVLAGLGTALALLGPKVAAGFKPPQTGATVRVEPASLGELIEIVSAPGIVEPEVKVSISARVSAQIVELPYDEGDAVTKGDPNANPPVPPSVLVRLDSKEIEAQLRAAEARRDGQLVSIEAALAQLAAQELALRETTVQLEASQRDLSRLKTLLATNDISQQSVDDAQTNVDRLVAQVETARARIEAERTNLGTLRFQLAAAEADIDRIRDNLRYTTIVSPIDGVVIKRRAEVGEIAITGTMNNPGTVILEVADLTKMLVRARVDESDVAAVKVGQPVRVRMQAYAGKVFDGVVKSVALSRTEAPDRSIYFETEILLDTVRQQVLSGLNADAEIETRRHTGVLRVPSQAVLGRVIDDLPADIRSKPEVDQNKTIATVVYKVVDGKAIATPVVVGPSDLTHTIIEAGIAEGDLIVVGPYKALESLRHNQPVRIENPSSPKTDESKSTETARND